MNDYTLYLVKRAYYKKQLIKRAEEMQQQSAAPTLMDRFRNRSTLGMLLASGVNGAAYDDKGNIIGPADPTLKSRGRQLAAIGTIGAGTVGGGYAGNKVTKWLNKKLGLTADRGGWRRDVGKLLRVTGTLGGAYLGGKGGMALAGTYAGKLDPEEQRKAIDVQRKELAGKNNVFNIAEATIPQIKAI